MKELLNKIEKARNEQGLSIYKLTELSGLSENTIYNWYKKNSKPTIYALQAVCGVLNVSLADFFSKQESTGISDQEQRLLIGFRNLNSSQKNLCLQLVKELNKTKKETPEKNP